MVRTVDLFREYPTTLTTLFNTCFLSNTFEEEFLYQQLQNDLSNTPSPKKPRITKPTVTDWIYDKNQPIPTATAKKLKNIKGVYTRMKFYKIKESDNGKQIKLTPVTENQKYWFYNKFSNEYCVNKSISISNSSSVIYVSSLVLPQSSISKEPIFRIEVLWKIYSINNNKVKIEIKLKVSCSVKAWGVSSFIERFLMNQALNTYKNWLKYVMEQIKQCKHVNKQVKQNPKVNNDIVDDSDDDADDIDDTDDDDIMEQFVFKRLDDHVPKLIMKPKINKINQNVNINVGSKINGDISSVMKANVTQRMNVSNIGNNSNSNSNDISINITNDKDNNDNDVIHESRGLSKPSAPFKIRTYRFGARICPSFFLRQKKSNIDIMVDSRCEYLEKTLWCVIVMCGTMILLLTCHRYQNN